MRFYDVDVSRSMFEVETPQIQPITKKSKRGRWARTEFMEFGNSILLFGPVKPHHFYYCPDCFAIFVKANNPGRGRRATLNPIKIESLPENLTIKTPREKMGAIHDFSRTCECKVAPVKIMNYEELGLAFDLLIEQVASWS